MTSRFLLVILVAAFLSGCASLPPGSDFPKTASWALVHSEETRFGRQFADAARDLTRKRMQLVRYCTAQVPVLEPLNSG